MDVNLISELDGVINSTFHYYRRLILWSIIHFCNLNNMYVAKENKKKTDNKHKWKIH